MNYYNPYFSTFPYMNTIQKTGIFSRIFGNNINLGSILTGTQKTLNIVNQAIPIIKQAGPVFNNAKTMFKVMNEFKKVETPISESVNETNNEVNLIEIKNENTPTFFA